MSVDRHAERGYVRNWVETARMLEEIRWQELRVLSDDAARRATNQLLAAAVLVPLPPRRRQWSGLVEMQEQLHARR
jgi:hypothetical protein